MSNCTNSVVRTEPWGMRSAERREANVLKMKCLRSLVGVHECIGLGKKRGALESWYRKEVSE